MNFYKGLSAFLLLLFLGFTQKSVATHIVGGDITYTLLDSSANLYEIRLTLLRDCLSGQAPFDASITLFIFEGQDSNRQTISINGPTMNVSTFPVEFPNSCGDRPPSVCVESGQYITQVNLPPSPIGYDIGWARCCLAQTLTNISNPLGGGLTFTTSIPPSAQGYNSSPSFNSTPEIVVCGNNPFNFDYSATDIDGDSLVYSFSQIDGSLNTRGQGAGNPMQGGNDPTVGLVNNPMGSPPYVPLTFLPSYDSLNPYNADSLHFDELSGKLSGKGIDPGFYLSSVVVKEYRNGVFLSQVKQIGSITVINCQENPISSELIFPIEDTVINGNRTVFIEPGDSLCYEIFVNNDDPLDSIFVGLRNDTLGIQVGLDSLSASLCYQSAPDDMNGVCYFVEVDVRSATYCGNGPASREIFKVCIDDGMLASNTRRNNLDENFSLQPNPGRNQLGINLEALPFREGEVKVLDINGKLAYSQNWRERESQINIDTQNWPSGIYFVQINSEGKSGVKIWLKE